MRIGGLQLDIYDYGRAELIAQREQLEKIGALDHDLLTPEQLERLPDQQFGLVGFTKRGEKLRRFPLHDADHTKLAGFFFLKNAAKLPVDVAEIVALRIHAASTEHAVPSPVGDLVEDYDQTKLAAAAWGPPLDLSRAPDFTLGDRRAAKTARAEENDYAAVIEQNGEKVGIYYVGHEQALKEAAATFQKDYGELTPELRVVVAEALQERLAAQGLPVPEKIASYASTTISDELPHWLAARKTLVPQEAHRALDQLWEKRAELSGRGLGRALESFDRLTGLHEEWDHRIPDPYASCYTTPPEPVVKLGSRTVSEADIRKIAQQTGKLAQFLSPEAIMEFQADPVAVFESFPRPEKEMLIGVLER